MRFIQERMLHLGLWPQTALAVSLGFSVLFVAFAVLSEWALRDSSERLLAEQLVIARLTASQLDAVLAAAVYELEQAYHSADPGLLATNLPAETQIINYMHAESGDFSAGITFLDPTGRVVLSHPSSLYSTGRNLAGVAYIAQALERRTFTVSEPFIEPTDQRPVVAIAVPLHDGQRFIGLLKGRVDLSGPNITEPLQQAARIGHTAHAALVDRQGRNLVSTLDLPFLSSAGHVAFYRQVMARGVPTVECVPFEFDLPGETYGEPHVIAFAPLRLAPWGVAVGGDEDEVFAGVRQLRLGMIVLGGFALVGVWGVTLVGTRRLLQPVRRLTEGAQRIADGDLDTPLQGPDRGEIGALATALERMRRQLLADIEQLADRNETLETRVAEQTEELHQQQTQTQQLLDWVGPTQEGGHAQTPSDLPHRNGQAVSKRNHTLLVTPDEAWRARLFAELTQNGFEQVSQAAGAMAALSLFDQTRPDLVVVEAQLPDADGLAFCRMIRSLYPTVKVVLLADETSLQMTALQGNAAGCINRDFPLSEWPGLLSYVNGGGIIFSQAAIDETLARTSLIQTEKRIISVGPLLVDLIGRQVTLSGQQVNLTPREFALLACLARNVGRVVTFDHLLNEAWGYSSELGTEAQVRLYITRLRRKLVDDPQTPDLIISERGIGYRLRSQGQWRQDADYKSTTMFNPTRLPVASFDIAGY